MKNGGDRRKTNGWILGILFLPMFYVLSIGPVLGVFYQMDHHLPDSMDPVVEKTGQGLKVFYQPLISLARQTHTERFWEGYVDFFIIDLR